MKNFSDIDTIISKLRREYSFGKLEEKDADSNPYRQFVKWFESAVQAKSRTVNALTLATADPQGKPSVRIVLLKSMDSRGFVFFSNYQSLKGKQSARNAKAEILFYWPEVERQVRVSGRLTKLPRKDSRGYFCRRPRSAQISAWASDQSRPIKNRAALEAKVREYEKKFAGKNVPLPEKWGGFRLIPQTYEFWQGRESRLNDRLLYRRSAGKWKMTRLQP